MSLIDFHIRNMQDSDAKDVLEIYQQGIDSDNASFLLVCFVIKGFEFSFFAIYIESFIINLTLFFFVIFFIFLPIFKILEKE